MLFLQVIFIFHSLNEWIFHALAPIKRGSEYFLRASFVYSLTAVNHSSFFIAVILFYHPSTS